MYSGGNVNSMDMDIMDSDMVFGYGCGQCRHFLFYGQLYKYWDMNKAPEQIKALMEALMDRERVIVLLEGKLRDAEEKIKHIPSFVYTGSFSKKSREVLTMGK